MQYSVYGIICQGPFLPGTGVLKNLRKVVEFLSSSVLISVDTIFIKKEAFKFYSLLQILKK